MNDTDRVPREINTRFFEPMLSLKRPKNPVENIKKKYGIAIINPLPMKSLSERPKKKYQLINGAVIAMGK